MPAKMTDEQLTFWRELLAPFEPFQLSTVRKAGGELTYVDSRALFNRLDSVCGPFGWTIEYRETDRGYTARVGIAVPMGDEDSRHWLFKEDGGGFEDMGSKNKATGEFEVDTDNDEKSAYTNAARRAIQNAWGLGRYLYRKGIPTFLEGNDAPQQAAPKATEFKRPAPSEMTQTERTTRDHTPPPQAPDPGMEPSPTRPPAERVYDNFKIPRAGKQVFAWAKEMEKVFETALVEGMSREGNKLGIGSTFTDWTQQQVDQICMGVIGYIKANLPTYKGQYDYLFTADKALSAPAPAASPAPAPAPTPGVNLADLRKTLMAKMQEHVVTQTGKPAEPAALKAAFLKVAYMAANSEGKTGLDAVSLSGLTDPVWIQNMIRLVESQIEAAKLAGDGDEDIPF